MSNFAYLKNIKAYELFADACVEAEAVFNTSPAMSAIGARKALELAVRWVYAADTSIKEPYLDNLSALIHEQSFRDALDRDVWGKLTYIVKLGNLSAHTQKQVSEKDAMLSLAFLFKFVSWIEYCYGSEYEERRFCEESVTKAHEDEQIKEQKSQIEQKDSQIEALLKQIESLSTSYSEKKTEHQETRSFTSEDLSEYETRRRFIDVDLKLMGWEFGKDCFVEVEVSDMAGVRNQAGFADYVLYGKDGLPLAVIEAKRTSKDAVNGRQQCKLYADALEKKYKHRPMMFYTNGYETHFWDDLSHPPRRVSSVFSKDDLEKLTQRRKAKEELKKVIISDKITNRYYQKEAIRAVCENIEKGHRKNLLVMATGTGKTRTASSLTDVLSRAKAITNILFLADRTALVRQARDDFRTHLPDMSLCNLLSNKEDKNARAVFSTYPTILNAIDYERSEDGKRFYTPAHFDLIIIDEAHRSIFKKYRAIFEYFDAIIVGLTATPKTEVDRNTYDFFEMEQGVPTYAYDYDTAVNKDRVLVPFYTIEVKTKFLEEGIKYDELSEEDKERFEEDFDEDGEMPEFVPPEKLNTFVFNQKTVDMVLADLMERGIKTQGGDRVGKSIIFAQNKKHAEYIINRFDKLYPQYNGTFARRIVCDDAYAQSIIDDFKQPSKMPQIAVSVDMMDTGIDVPEVLNLVFFKKVRSKTKFWQMIGRGTRLCPELDCVDGVDGGYMGKKRFFIFDYCSNFEYFRAFGEGIETTKTKTLSENIFEKQICLIMALGKLNSEDEAFEKFRNALILGIVSQIERLNPELVSVMLERKYVEKYRRKEAFTPLLEQDKHELVEKIAPIVFNDEMDEFAKRFDSLMYGLMVCEAEKITGFTQYKNRLYSIA